MDSMAINPLSSSFSQAAQGTSATSQVGRHHGHHGNRDQMLTDAAAVIGIDVSSLKSQLQQGKSIADVASANGVSLDQLKAGLTDKLKTRLAADVASGKITQQQADNMTSRITAGLTNLLTRTAQGAGPMAGRAGGGDRDGDGDGR
jgi:hypothetical protein